MENEMDTGIRHIYKKTTQELSYRAMLEEMASSEDQLADC